MLWAPVEWHFSFRLMNSFNETEAVISPVQAMLSWDFPFSQIKWNPSYPFDHMNQNGHILCEL